MRALHYIIVKSERTYNNTVNVGDLDYTVNVDIDDVSSINRTAEVVCAPDFMNLKPGDEVIIHHNIMRESIHTNGSLDKGHFLIGNGHYWLPVSEAIMKRNDEGNWETLHDFCFVQPIKEEVEELFAGLKMLPENYKGYKNHRAILRIGNKKLTDVKVGEEIMFAYNSQHEFIIDGELMYKCEVSDILAVVEK